MKSVRQKRYRKALPKSVNPGSSALDYEALVLAYVVAACGHSNKALLDMARHAKRPQLGGTVVNAGSYGYRFLQG